MSTNRRPYEALEGLAPDLQAQVRAVHETLERMLSERIGRLRSLPEGEWVREMNAQAHWNGAGGHVWVLPRFEGESEGDWRRRMGIDGQGDSCRAAGVPVRVILDELGLVDDGEDGG